MRGTLGRNRAGGARIAECEGLCVLPRRVCQLGSGYAGLEPGEGCAGGQIQGELGQPLAPVSGNQAAGPGRGWQEEKRAWADRQHGEELKGRLWGRQQETRVAKALWQVGLAMAGFGGRGGAVVLGYRSSCIHPSISGGLGSGTRLERVLGGSREWKV